MHTPFVAELPNLTWEGACFYGSLTPSPQGGGIPALPIFGFLSIYAYTLYPLYRRTTKFDVLTYMGGS